MTNAVNSIRIASARKYWLDVARVVAIISVTINHALSRSFSTVNNPSSEFLEMTAIASFLKALMYVFSRIGVPLFLMITGSLLMGRDYEDKSILRRFYHHNCKSLLIATEIWLLIMFCFLQVFEDSILRLNGPVYTFVKCLTTLLFISPTTLPNMWYMCMILPVYLMIPIMALGMKKFGNKPFYLLASIALVYAILLPEFNVVLYALGISQQLESGISVQDLFSFYFIYIFAGHWIGSGKLQRIKNSLLTVCLIVCFFCTSLFQFWLYSNGSNYALFYDDIGILITSVCLFELIRRHFTSQERAKRSVLFLAKSAFGVFMLHICIMHGMNTLISKDVVNHLPRFLLLEICGLGGALLIVWFASRIPFIRHKVFLIRD